MREMSGEPAAVAEPRHEDVVGVLYESSEWSDFKLAQEIAARGCPVRMVDMERPDAMDAALSCSLLVSRVFASALFRGHERSHAAMERVARVAEERGVPMVNPPAAHRFEVSKRTAARALGTAGLAVPHVMACDIPSRIEAGRLEYPCVIKPDCGGRSTLTAVARDVPEAEAFLAGAPGRTRFIVEGLVRAREGYVTRVEVVGGRSVHILKRSIAENGLSSYHVGSTYEAYPDCPPSVAAACDRAAALLSFEVGSFDVIETPAGEAVIIDANSVSNVSEDCGDLLGFDLMAEHAAYIAARWQALADARG